MVEQEPISPLVEYRRSVEIDVKGGLGTGIGKELSLNMGADTFLELKTDIGKVNKNEITQRAISHALEVMTSDITPV